MVHVESDRHEMGGQCMFCMPQDCGIRQQPKFQLTEPSWSMLVKYKEHSVGHLSALTPSVLDRMPRHCAHHASTCINPEDTHLIFFSS